MRINNNLLAINTHRQLGISAGDGAKSMEKLSSGFRINRAGDDAAGLAISEKMRGQIRGLTMASKNASDTISLIQTAEGALAETHSILQRMRELSVQSANDTNTDADRAELQAEVKQLKAEIDRIGNTTEFNTKKLLEGSAKGVSDETVGTARINNNSGVVVDALKMANMSASVSNDRNWGFDGAYMLIKTNQTHDASGREVHNAGDYKMVAPDGKVYNFTAIGKDTMVTSNGMSAGTIIADGGTEYKAAEAGTITDKLGLTAGITLGASVNETQVDMIGEDSVLAAGSTITLKSGQSFESGSGELGGTGTEVDTITYSAEGVLTVGGVEVAVGSTIIGDEGAVIKNEGGGTFTIVSGSLTVGADVTFGTEASGYTIASQSTLDAASTVTIDTTLVEASNYKLTGDGELSNNVTIGNSVNLTSADNITTLKEGSVLATGSDITFNTAAGATESLLLNVGGKEIAVSWDKDNGILKVGDTVVAAGKSVTLEDGTVLTHQAKLDTPTVASGELHVSTGSITLAQDVAAGTAGDANTFTFNVAKDSTLVAGTYVKADTTFNAGTVITEADTVFAGSVTLSHGAKNLQFSSNTAAALAANYFETDVGDSFTFVFTRYQAASSNLADSLMSQIGSNSGQTSFLSIGDMRSKALGVDVVDISTKWGAATAIETVNNAVQKVSHQRSLLGAVQNRLEHTIKNLDTAAENLQAAESRIRDVDMAKEVMEFTKTNILQQAAQAMLAQANQAPQSVLQLLR
jgi:flagellin